MPVNPSSNLNTFLNVHNYAGGAGGLLPPGYSYTLQNGKYFITYSVLDNEDLSQTYYASSSVSSRFINNYIPAGSSNPSYNQSIENAIVEIFSAGESNDTFGALYRHVAELDFNETYGSAAIGTIAIGQGTVGAFTQPNFGAATQLYTYDSGGNYPIDPDENALYGDIWLNRDDPNNRWYNDTHDGSGNLIDLEAGTWSYKVLLEEISHSLGIDIYNTGTSGSPGANPNGLLGGAANTNYLNSQKYSVTSYKTHPDLYQDTANQNEYFPTELALYDIYALQQIYGANEDTRNTATTYTFGTNQAFGTSASVPFIYTIWDGGGRDLISADGYTDGVEIDLRQGRFSSIGKKGDAGNNAVEWDNTYSGTAPNPDPGNVAIAFGAIIEDAEGTDERDIIIGNAWDNVLYGGEGDDDLYGDGVVSPDMDIGYGAAQGEYDEQHPDGTPAADGSGNDTLWGGDGEDTLKGGAGDDIFFSDEGSGALIFSNVIDGGAGFDAVNYDYNAAEDAIYDFIVNTTAQDKLNGIYEVNKTMNAGTPVVDDLSGIERVALAEHRANTTTKYNQQEAVVAGLDNGQYVVVWKSQSQSSQTYALVYQRFDKFGEKVGSENVITSKTVTGSHNYEPQVVDTGGGSFAVVWTGRTTAAQSDAYAPNRWKTFVSKYGANDVVASTIDAKMVFADPDNNPTDNLKRTQEYQPDITVLSDGNLAITAEAHGDGLVNADIITQIIAIGTGDRIGANEDVAVNTITSLNQVSPETAALSGGGYVITWVGQDGDQSGIFGRIYTNAGAPSGGQFQINSSIFDNQLGQKVTAVSDGSFIVTWAHEQNGSYDVLIRHFNGDGTARSDEILVNEHTVGAQSNPDIEMLDSSRFVVVFQQDDAAAESQGSSVWGQQYDIDAQTGDIEKQGKNFQINVTESGSQDNPELGVTPDGDFVVTYISDQLGLSPNRDDIALRTYLTSDSVI